VAFLFRLIPPRPTFAQDMTAQEREVMGRHAAHWRELLDRGTAVAFGPVLDPDGAWGLGLLDVAVQDDASEIANSDPAVQSGVCTYELLPMQLVR
jgi:uncharacterized protein YciI